MGDRSPKVYTDRIAVAVEAILDQSEPRSPCSHLTRRDLETDMHVCLFDIDGTLINTSGAGKCAMEGALREAFGVTAPTHGIPYAGRTDRAIAEDLFRYHGVEVTQEGWEFFRETYLELLKSCLRDRPGVVLPGIQSLLEHLAERKAISIGLLTGNIRAGAYRKLSHFSLDHYFTFGGFGDDHTNRDDVARSALRVVAEKSEENYHPDRLWVIGDTPADVQCGRAIGARTIAVATGTHTLAELRETSPDYALSDLTCRDQLIELWS